MRIEYQEASLNSATFKSTSQSQKSTNQSQGIQPEISVLPGATGDAPAWSSALTTLLNQPPASLPIRLMVGGGFFLLSVTVWSWFSHIDQVGVAQGKLIPEGDTYKVESVQMGKVRRIAVEEGESVQAGQVIAELDSDLEQGEVNKLRQQIKALNQELSQKKALFQQTNLEFQTQAQIASTDVIGHHHAIEAAQHRLDVLKRLNRRQQQERDALHQRRIRLASLKELSDLQGRELVTEIKAHQERMQRLTRLESQGAISKEAVFIADQGLRQTQKQLTESKLNRVSSINEQLFQAEQAIRDIDAALLQGQGDFLTTSQEIKQLQVTLAVKESDIERLELEAQQALNLLEQDMTRIQAQIDENHKLLEASVLRLDQQVLRSPISGVVLLSHIKNTGKVIQPGQTIAEIASHASPLIIQARLPNRDAGFIEVGMPVQIKMNAYPFQEYGVIPGKILSISADSITDDNLGEVYLVDVSLQKNYVMNDQKKIYFKPGQTAEASIQIRQRRILDMLLDPIRQLQS